MIFEEIENLEKSKPKLHFKRYIHDETLSLKDFILLFIKKLNLQRNTYENNIKQCEKYCNRSFGDIYRLILSYYPNTTVKELYSILFSFYQEKKIQTLYCPDINKRIFCHFRAYTSSWCDFHFNNIADEYGNLSIKKYLDD